MRVGAWGSGAGRLLAIGQVIKRVPLVARFLRTHRWQSFRHGVVLRTSERREGETFTRFLRVPAQHDALAGPVIEFLRPAENGSPLRIAVLGCANGAEAYSIASTLRLRCPRLGFELVAGDIDADAIAKARSATYRREELYRSPLIGEAFVAHTFDKVGEEFVVKSEVAALISFHAIDIRDQTRCASHGAFDIVFVQNVLLNMRRAVAAKAFENCCRMLGARSALFVDGMDLDMRAALTAKYGLRPLEYRIEDIHDDAMVLRGIGWPWHYWGLEPIVRSRGDWKRRYATIFLKSD
jgi:chemotaxis methyl-accepting protein methylase